VAVVSGGGRGLGRSFCLALDRWGRLRRASVVEGGTVPLPDDPDLGPEELAGLLAQSGRGELLEKHMARSGGAAYADYVRRTSGFVPWPPRPHDIGGGSWGSRRT
jgi:hypothetical protein